MDDETEGTEPQLAEDLDEADPAEAERLMRGSWPATDEELAERDGARNDERTSPRWAAGEPRRGRGEIAEWSARVGRRRRRRLRRGTGRLRRDCERSRGSRDVRRTPTVVADIGASY